MNSSWICHEKGWRGGGSQNWHQALYISSHRPTRGRFTVFNL